MGYRRKRRTRCWRRSGWTGRSRRAHRQALRRPEAAVVDRGARSYTIRKWSFLTSRPRRSIRGSAQPVGPAARASHSQGRTVVLTTHYLDEAEALCEQVRDHGRRGGSCGLGAPATLVRGLDAPTRIGIEGGLLSVDEAARGCSPRRQRRRRARSHSPSPRVSPATGCWRPSPSCNALNGLSVRWRHARRRVPPADRTGVPRMIRWGGFARWRGAMLL